MLFFIFVVHIVVVTIYLFLVKKGMVGLPLMSLGLLPVYGPCVYVVFYAYVLLSLWLQFRAWEGACILIVGITFVYRLVWYNAVILHK